jgi:hypothetical protein
LASVGLIRADSFGAGGEAYIAQALDVKSADPEEPLIRFKGINLIRIDADRRVRPCFIGHLAKTPGVSWSLLNIKVTISLKSGRKLIVEPGSYPWPDNNTDTYRVFGDGPPEPNLGENDIDEMKLEVTGGSYIIGTEVNSFEGPVAKDRTCYRDIKSAVAKGGVAGRQELIEAERVGCLQTLTTPFEVIDPRSVPGYPEAREAILRPPADATDEKETHGIILARSVQRRVMQVAWNYKGPAVVIWQAHQ